MKIDETHQLEVEPGPYPPGEGPLDYVECLYGCRDLRLSCANTWPTEGWVAVEEPDRRKWETAPSVDFDSCSWCETPLGYTEGEYEGQYGLRLVQVWTDAWTHPKCPDVTLCEECSLFVEDGEFEI